MRKYFLPFCKILLVLLIGAQAVHAQQDRVAIMPTIDDADSISHMDLNFLTSKLREIAGKSLPGNRYGIMTQESIVDRMGSQERAEQECRNASCLADLGRRVSAAYISQGRIGRFGGRLTLKVELYNSKSGNLVSSFTGDSENLFGLSSVLDEKAPEMFRSLLSAAGGSYIFGGISGLERAADYELAFEKRHLAHLLTEPQGAFVSFDGVPNPACAKTPCRVELAEGNVRIVAALDQYETADTMVAITSNNQSINLKLKSSFGYLQIEPAYSKNIGSDKRWRLTINGKEHFSFANKFSPGNYEVKLSHECYEDISFKAGITKGSHEIFSVAKYMQLKKGGLDLSAEKDGKPIGVPVFVNGEKVGETPFAGAVPMCSEIEVGEDRRAVDVELRYRETAKFLVEMDYGLKIGDYLDSHDYSLDKEAGIGFDYAKEKSKSKGILTASSLTVGAICLFAGLMNNRELDAEYEAYRSLPRGKANPEEGNAWRKVKDAENWRNGFYIAGGIFFALGMGVGIWF